jgi:putative transposase
MSDHTGVTHAIRNHPVHMTPIERHNASVILLITLCVRTRAAVFDNDAFHDAFRQGAREADAWRVGSYMIMPDHLHFFCRPATLPNVGVEAWCRFLKRRISKQLGPHDWKWQADCWDRQMRDPKHYEERYAYVTHNPVRAGLVSDSEAWPHQGVLSVLDG